MRRALIAFVAIVGFSVSAYSEEARLLPMRLADAKVGEWVLMADITEPTETIRSEVIGREEEDGEDVVVIKRETLDVTGNVVERKERRVKLSRYTERMHRLEDKATRITREKMDFKDQVLTVFVVEVFDEKNDREIKIWFSNELPVSGILRIWSSDPDFPTYELVDYGQE